MKLSQKDKTNEFVNVYHLFLLCPYVEYVMKNMLNTC